MIDRESSGPATLNERRSSRSRAARSASTTRRCATESRRSASSSIAGAEARDRPRPRRARRRPDRGRLPARLGGGRATRSGRSPARACAPRSGASPAPSRRMWRRSSSSASSAAVIESPVSDAKLAALGVVAGEMLERIRKAVSFAAQSGITVAFFGVDGSRADLGFFSAPTRRRSRPARRRPSSSTRSAIADPRGCGVPRRPGASTGSDVPVHWHGHNDFGLATAAAVAAVRAGATWVHGTINGMGERAGNANLGEVALALDALYGIPTGSTSTKAARAPRSCASVRATSSTPWKPVDGREPLHRESGAVASQFHDPPAIEPYSSELVGAERGMCWARRAASTRSG